jgi:hypothetical protein
VANLKGAKKRGLPFWQAAVARVQAGENLAEVALELGVDRRGLARWQERLDPEMLRAGRLRERGWRRKWSSCGRHWPRRYWRWIFCAVPCTRSRYDAGRAQALASRGL